LEPQGEAQRVSAAVLVEAFWTMLRARDACRDGRIEAAFTLYDRIIEPQFQGD
jgi:hypothetical protein